MLTGLVRFRVAGSRFRTASWLSGVGIWTPGSELAVWVSVLSCYRVEVGSLTDSSASGLTASSHCRRAPKSLPLRCIGTSTTPYDKSFSSPVHGNQTI